jgi:hypothetical protein
MAHGTRLALHYQRGSGELAGAGANDGTEAFP